MGTEEDEDGMTLSNLHGISYGGDGDESSVDIYDDLDNTLVVPGNCTSKVPVESSLNLFDEILIEEETAKEATFNELQAEHEKCKQQLQELTKKLQEIQEQNSLLQSENLSLKKNISALIKTARVEINRKDEEISNLQRRLTETPVHYNTYSKIHTRNVEVSKERKKSSDFFPEDNSKIDPKIKQDVPRDVSHNSPPWDTENKKVHLEKKDTTYISQSHPEQFHKDGVPTKLSKVDSSCDEEKEKREIKKNEHYSKDNDCRHKTKTQRNIGSAVDRMLDTPGKSQVNPEKLVRNISQSHPEQFHKDGVPTKLSKVDSSCDEEKEKREIKKSEHYSKDNDCRHKTKTQRNIGSAVDCMLDTPGKSQVNPEKLVRNGQWKDRKDLKIKSSWCAGNKTDNISSTKEKQSVPKDKLMLKTEHINEDRLEKLQIINQKDLKKEKKEESSSKQKNRQPDKYVEQQRDGKTANIPENSIFVRNPKEFSKGYLEDKIKHHDCRKTKGTDDPGLQGGKSSLPHSSNRERKLSNSNTDSRKYEPGRTHSKSDKYRMEAKRKSRRDKSRESRNSRSERRNSKETPPKTVKENIKLKDSAKREKKKTFSSKETAMIVEASNKPAPIKVERDEEQSKSKDLKLSFMQKLNLTLSPAKKQTDKPKIVAETTNEGEMEVPSQEIMLVPNEPINTTSEAKMPLGPIHNGPLQIKSEKTTSVSEIKANQQNETPEMLDSEPCKAFPQNATVQHEMVGNEKFLPPTETEMQDSEEVHVAPSPTNPMDPEMLLNHSFRNLETGCSVDSDTFRVIDEVNGTDSDSSMAKEESSNVVEKKILEYSENESLPLPKTGTEDDKILCVNSSIPDPKTEDLNPRSPKHGSQMESLCNKGLNAVSQTDSNPVSVDDDNSILSIDLNHMRYIPIAISPLNSPMRPLGKIFRMETSYKVTNYNTDFAPDSAVDYLGSNHSSELNKENQKPVCSAHKILEESQLNVSSDELEEGEIVSDVDDEPKIEKKTENSKKLKRKMSPERSNTSKNTYNHNVKSVSPNEGPGKLTSARKSKEKPKDGTITFSKEMKKNKLVSIDCLEKIVHITAEPSTLHEFMQMLKTLRKQVRKNYMKLKIQFPIQQFHKIIDSSVLHFTSLIKYIDFSKMCKSNEAVKVKLCEVIESELNKIKKNTAIEYLFEKQQSDMKKKLWKFVDEQLDYLFDKIKEILLKLGNLISLGTENEDGKRKRKKGSSKCLDNKKINRQRSEKPNLNAKVKRSQERVLPKPVVGSQPSKADHQEINETARHKNTVKKNKHSHTDSTRSSLPEVAHFKQNSTEDPALKTGKYEKEGLDMIGDPHKSDISCGPLTEQQMSGLTFNLVNDAQMGEMFKSLLQGSGLSEKNIDFIDENQWEFRTPEKQMLEGQSGSNNPAYETEETTSRDIQVESRILDGIKWPIVSPERDSTFLARLQMPIDPNILDENCMFEIPTSPTLKKSEVCVLEKQKSLVSSILLEDLAVSLTIPSPLKSDAHLSFLKPDVLGSVPEDVLNAHFSEDAHLEEEDASEQDIHLALESDNSSSKSSCSSWANIPTAPGFQYCPSLPMQAVIMEKSNDHFIVKIRRAAPSMSPTDQTAIPDEPISVIEKGKNEITYEENLATLTSQSIPSGEIEIPKEIVNNNDSGEKMDNQMKNQISHSMQPLKETSVCLAIDSVPGLFEPQQDLHPDTPGDVITTIESLLHKNRQEQSCDVSLEVQRPFCNTSQIQNPHLFFSNQVSLNDAPSEKPPDLQDPPEELRISKEPLEESSNKINQNAAAPEVFKLPQTIPIKVFREKDVTSAKIKDFPVRSRVNAPVEQPPSQNHFDTHTGLTDVIPMESKLNPTEPIEQSSLNYRVRSLCKDQEKHEADSHCEVADRSKTEVEENVNWPDMSTRDGSFEKNATFNIDGQKCPIKPSKESKKRKKETEEASSAKKQRKENNELDLKKIGKNSKSRKERTSVASSLFNTKPASTRDKDLLSSTSTISPSNLWAKNIIKKKGEVVISWTRNDDRVILLECQKKGPSGKTFTFVAEQLKKTPAQVEERFKQLVKLFRMSTGS